MSRFKLHPLLALSVAAALALSACGGDDDDGGDDADQVTEVVETALTSTDPADCTELRTQAFNEHFEFETGEAATTSCEESATDENDGPDAVEASAVEVDGSEATADGAFTGGAFDGSTVSFSLVKEDDQWKLDAITDIPEFDFEGTKAAFADQFGSGEIPPEVVTCITDALDATGPDAVKEAFLSGDQQQLLGIIGPCVGGGA